jgi:hypothetical protein
MVFCWSRGLLASKMIETAAGMVDNFLTIVQFYGFFPNGTRTYYENRRLVKSPHTSKCLLHIFFLPPRDGGVLEIFCVSFVCKIASLHFSA